MMNFNFDTAMMSLNDEIERHYWYEVMIQEKTLEKEGRILDEEEFLQEFFEDDFGLGMATNFYLERCKGIKFNAEMLSDMILFVIKMAEERLQEFDSAEIDTLEEMVNRYAYDYILNNYLGWGRDKIEEEEEITCEECKTKINISQDKYDYDDDTGFYLCENCYEEEDDDEEQDEEK